MTSPIQPTPTYSDTTAPEKEAAMDLSIASAAWIKTARAECQLQLLRDLQAAKVGVAAVEEFLEDLEGAMKSKKKKKKVSKRDTDLMRRIMEKKVRDAEEVWREADTRKCRLRRKIQDLHGKNTRKTRKTIKDLRKEARREKKIIQEKHQEKIDHLKKKYGEKNVEKNKICPEDLRRYENLSILIENGIKSEDLEEVLVAVIGTEVDIDEKSFLELPPKYSIYKLLCIEAFEVAMEICNAKVRYDAKKRGDENNDTELIEEVTDEERERIEEIEAEQDKFMILLLSLLT